MEHHTSYQYTDPSEIIQRQSLQMWEGENSARQYLDGETSFYDDHDENEKQGAHHVVNPNALIALSQEGYDYEGLNEDVPLSTSDIPDRPTASAPKAKRGRKGHEMEQVWPQQETIDLIGLWGSREVLYNAKHKSYSDKTVRNKLLLEMSTELKIPVVAISKKNGFFEVLLWPATFKGRTHEIVWRI